MNEVDNAIQQRFKDSNLTIASLANRSGLSYMTIKKLLNEGASNAYLNTVLAVCTILGIQITVKESD